MPISVMPLIAQTVLESAVVAWAGWEVWRLRAPKVPKDPAAPPPSADPAGHPVGEQGLDDRGP